MRRAADLPAPGAAAAPVAGSACAPVLFTPAPVPAEGEACGVIRYRTEVRAVLRAVGLSRARDRGGGPVRQDIFDGNACSREENMIVHDGTRGEAPMTPDGLAPGRAGN
jgi:hypothetical protein